MNAPIGDGSCAVDAMLTWPQGGLLGLVIDGSSHFTTQLDSGERRPTGAVFMRDALFSRWGVPVLVLAAADFSADHLDERALVPQLAALLRSQGAPLPPR